MLVLRCTARLLRQLRVEAAADPPAPTTHLGAWYANLLHFERRPVVLAVSEVSFLPVVVHASPAHDLFERLRVRITDVMQAIEVVEDAVRTEDAAMRNVVVGRTASRVVLGVLNDFARLAEEHLVSGDDFHDVSVQLTNTPCGPIGMESPARKTRAVFAEQSDRAPSTWDDIQRLALSFDGYRRTGSMERCTEIASRVERAFHEKGAGALDPLDIDILRTALFFEQRRWRHYGYEPDAAAMRYIHALVAALGAQNGTAWLWDCVSRSRS